MLILPEKLRHELKKPFGDLYPSIEEAPVNKEAFIISVGDVTTYNLLKAGIKPNLAIIDKRVQRKDSSYDIKYDAKILKCRNPPGTLTDELCSKIEEAIKSAIKDRENFLIIVDGEEDLAVIPSILSAPPHAIIFYGQPHKGLVLVEAKKAFKKVEELIKRFEEA